jgi:preprotein translocase subunit SecD
MRGNNGVKFFLVILIIGILTYLAVNGATVFGFKIKSAFDYRPGIDINGGVHVTFSAKKDSGVVTQEELDSAKQVIGRRLDNKQIYDRNITTDVVKGRIIVEIPMKKGETTFDPQAAIDEIGKTAHLTFQEVDENLKDADTGAYKPTGKIVLEGKNVLKAFVDTDTQKGGNVVSLELDKTGTDSFAEATSRLVGKKIAIFMDDQLISAPSVESAIPNGKAIITGQRTPQEAKELANTIKAGNLPFALEAQEVNSISPTLGESALKVIFNAFLVAFVLVCIFMISYYRLPGVLADIALLGHTVIQLLVISWAGITLTLPGIAGVILTVGMGVDANVIIFERIKEELRNGKTLRAAIDVGFKRAFTAIFDANMTTLITAAVLYMFGTGALQSFAITLFLGVILSFLTAVTVSRIMIKSASDLDIAKHHWLYGA